MFLTEKIRVFLKTIILNPWLPVLLLMLGVGYFYQNLVDTQVMGFIHDDGIYAIMGSALQQGKGYHLLHLPGNLAQVTYPFFYPLMLAGVWFLNPHFPQNLPWLSGLNVVFVMLSVLTLFFYCKQLYQLPRWLTFIVVFLSFSNFFSLYYYTVVMSESLYLLLTLLTLIAAHCVTATSAQKRWVTGWGGWTILVMLSSMLAMTRLLGFTMILAITIWLLVQKRYRYAIGYAIACGLTSALPWGLWLASHSSVITDLNYPLLNVYSNYGTEIRSRIIAGQYMLQIQYCCLMLIDMLGEVLLPVVIPLFKEKSLVWPQVAAVLHWLVYYGLFGYILLSGVKSVMRTVFSKKEVHVSIPGLYIGLYLLAITLWNYHDQMARFLVVLTPLLWVSLLKPLASVITGSVFSDRSRQPGWKSCLGIGILLFLVVMTTFTTVPSYQRIAKSRSQHWVEAGKMPWLWSEYQDSFAWIKAHCPQQTVLSCMSDVVYYLYTGRKTFYTFFPSIRLINNQPPDNATDILMASMKHYHVQYLVVEPTLKSMQVIAPQNLIMVALLHSFPERFKPVYHSPRWAITIYRIVW
jgi:hypothetical protein